MRRYFSRVFQCNICFTMMKLKQSSSAGPAGTPNLERTKVVQESHQKIVTKLKQELEQILQGQLERWSYKRRCYATTFRCEAKGPL